MSRAVGSYEATKTVSPPANVVDIDAKVGRLGFCVFALGCAVQPVTFRNRHDFGRFCTPRSANELPSAFRSGMGSVDERFRHTNVRSECHRFVHPRCARLAKTGFAERTRANHGPPSPHARHGPPWLGSRTRPLAHSRTFSSVDIYETSSRTVRAAYGRPRK